MSTAVPFRYRRWFLLPLWPLVFLILFPPHALDISVSHLFFSVDHWPWHRVEWFSTLFHKAAKGIPIAVALVTLGALVRDALRRKKGLPERGFPSIRRFARGFSISSPPCSRRCFSYGV